MRVPVLLITGPVGVGKTTIALEISNLLEQAGHSHAVVDLDALSWAYPAPLDDPFNTRLAFRNLAAVWANYAAMGVERLVIAYVVETRGELDAHSKAIPGAELTIVRLRASIATLHARVTDRERGLGREWSLHRTVELAELMDANEIEDYLVETDGRSVLEVAQDVLSRAQWC